MGAMLLGIQWCLIIVLIYVSWQLTALISLHAYLTAKCVCFDLLFFVVVLIFCFLFSEVSDRILNLSFSFLSFLLASFLFVFTDLFICVFMLWF